MHKSSTPQPPTSVNPVARVLLAAVYLPSPKSPFRLLAECPELVELIYSHLRQLWKSCITLGFDNETISRYGNEVHPSWATDVALPTREQLANVALSRLARRDISFPKPTQLVCNMLPFLAADPERSIPEEFHGYLGLISTCRHKLMYELTDTEVWYLTIQESRVETRRPQRRGGIHTEGFLASAARCERVAYWHRWGMLLGPRSFKGGIFHASTVDSSCRMWNVSIPREPSAALHIGCDLEHLRGVLNEMSEPVEPLANELYWMTDATPHESLPLKKGTYRQYFRLVTGDVSAWWEKHSTKNRLGIQPNCRIIRHSKFEKDAYVGLYERDNGSAPPDDAGMEESVSR